MTRRALIVAVLLALAAGACTSEEVLDVRRPAEGASAGGTVIVGITPPGSVDPAGIDGHDPSGRLVVKTMCDPLVQLDPVTGEPVGAVAESWTITDGGRRITVKMRSGVRFSDGTEVTSEDIAFTFFRVASAETASPAAAVLEPVEGYEFVHGEVAPEEGEELTELAGVETIDKFSFEITLKDRNADFLRALSHPALSPVSKAAAEADPVAFEAEPVCAGPYRLDGPFTAEATEIGLVRAAVYEPRNLGYTSGGPGYADRIQFRIYPDEGAVVAAYGAGEVDLVRLPWEALGDARATLAGDVVTSTTPTLEYVGLPVSQPPFDRREVRVALSQALDRERITAEVFEGARVPATGILPPAVGEKLYRENACGERAPAAGDVEAARRTLSGTGVDLSTVGLRLYYNDEFRNRALMEAVAAQWNAAFGVTAELQPLGWERYLATGTGQPGFDGPFRMGWAPQFPSPDGYLFPLFESSAIGRDNLTRFSSGDFDRTLERDARRATDDQEYVDEYQELEDIACGQMPIIPIGFGQAHHLVRTATLGGAADDVTDVHGDVMLRELYVR